MRVRDLGSARFHWSDLGALVKHRRPGSALAVAMDPRAAWTVTDYLLAETADNLRWLVWAKTKDAQRKRNRPKPIPRPGEKERDGRFTDVETMTVDQMKEFLARPRI